MSERCPHCGRSHHKNVVVRYGLDRIAARIAAGDAMKRIAFDVGVTRNGRLYGFLRTHGVDLKALKRSARA